MARRRFCEGMIVEGKKIKEVFRDGTGYMITFTDGTWKIYK
jgi:hypothetical protein